MNVEIRYNPYKMETVFLCNGTALQADKLVPFQHEHLQDWVERLPKSLFDVCNVTALDVTFVGTRQDYQDVEEAFQVWSKAEPNKPFTLSLQEAKSLDDTEAKLRELYDQVEAIAEKPSQHRKSVEHLKQLWRNTSK